MASGCGWVALSPCERCTTQPDKVDDPGLQVWPGLQLAVDGRQQLEPIPRRYQPVTAGPGAQGWHHVIALWRSCRPQPSGVRPLAMRSHRRQLASANGMILCRQGPWSVRERRKRSPRCSLRLVSGSTRIARVQCSSEIIRGWCARPHDYKGPQLQVSRRLQRIGRAKLSPALDRLVLLSQYNCLK